MAVQEQQPSQDYTLPTVEFDDEKLHETAAALLAPGPATALLKEAINHHRCGWEEAHVDTCRVMDMPNCLR